MSDLSGVNGELGSDFERLQALLGDHSLAQHAPVEVDGRTLTATLLPADGDALARSLACLSETGVAALIRGGGTRLALGNRPRRADLILSTAALQAVDVFDQEDGVAHVLAGTRLEDLRAQVNERGWEVPLDPHGETSTLGGTLAAAAIGPRRLSFGPPRDCVLGMEIALASGERTRCGGRVVKNVTGYDMAKLYTGSLGSLGVIEAAWIRLQPLPECTSVRFAELSSGSAALSDVLEVARRDSTRVAALITAELGRSLTASAGSAKGWLLVVEFAGHPAAVERDLRWLEDRVGPTQAAENAVAGDAVAALGKVQGRSLAGSGLRARIALLPSALQGSCEALLASGAQLVVHPGVGLVYAEQRFESSTAVSEIQKAAEVIERISLRSGGSFVFEELPAHAKRGFDVFGDPGPGLSLMRRLKQRFDPRAVLNPGRCAGGV